MLLVLSFDNRPDNRPLLHRGKSPRYFRDTFDFSFRDMGYFSTYLKGYWILGPLQDPSDGVVMELVQLFSVIMSA